MKKLILATALISAVVAAGFVLWPLPHLFLAKTC